MAEAGAGTVTRTAVSATGRAAPGTVWATWATVSTGLAQDGSAAVAGGDVGLVIGALADAAACHERHFGRPAVAAAYRRIARALGGAQRTTAGTDPGSLAAAGESGGAADIRSAVSVLDGSSRARLVTWLADTDPRLAARGLAWLAAEHAASAERDRIRRNRRATLRSRRRRRDTA